MARYTDDTCNQCGYHGDHSEDCPSYGTEFDYELGAFV
ncbi:hypothetical protein SEA_SLIMJIMMY_143 [Mycobacterium phage SlimJimmy]|uniref:Uncharacterized protein n=3 Tax=Bongovirus bongo TaxID=1983750 RepID=A0A0M4RC20_9CAUD|nr:hypothetical protein SEA_BRICOLE_147 [Mycobacterium phage Bricole]AXQ52765.1 hypothetical protein SEA_IPHANE7_143 [Mycobacterium phage IPhane7]QGJ93267.1 hypothetical protein SEA_TYDAWG_139 [Mycobacterium phage TyDawg]WMI33304.1 hypothetical protein SEA_SLIMJIMMY_143 [Mycobacterium phage SlimJimmy]WNM75336.1 hypothetical protein SEA_AUSPICE_146 [Mycobacterium phage Auspice]